MRNYSNLETVNIGSHTWHRVAAVAPLEGLAHDISAVSAVPPSGPKFGIDIPVVTSAIPPAIGDALAAAATAAPAGAVGT